jgi:hypothetical protein
MVTDDGTKMNQSRDDAQMATFQALRQQFGSELHRPLLRAIASVLIKTLNIPELSRKERSSFAELVRWFHINWEKIAPTLRMIELVDETEQAITDTLQPGSGRINDPVD